MSVTHVCDCSSQESTDHIWCCAWSPVAQARPSPAKKGSLFRRLQGDDICTDFKSGCWWEDHEWKWWRIFETVVFHPPLPMRRCDVSKWAWCWQFTVISNSEEALIDRPAEALGGQMKRVKWETWRAFPFNGLQAGKSQCSWRGLELLVYSTDTHWAPTHCLHGCLDTLGWPREQPLTWCLLASSIFYIIMGQVLPQWLNVEKEKASYESDKMWKIKQVSYVYKILLARTWWWPASCHQ